MRNQTDFFYVAHLQQITFQTMYNTWKFSLIGIEI